MLCGAVGVSLSMFFIPVCDNLSSLIFVLVVMGWCMGCLDCLANLKIIQMFGKNVAPFLQAMHCSYGIGAFVSPMIASAFLLNKDCTPYIDGFTVDTPSYQNQEDTNETSVKPVSLHIPPQPQRVFRYSHMSKLPKAFYILGGLQLLIAGLVAYVIFQEKLGKMKPRVVSTDHHDNGHALSPTKCFKVDKLGVWFRDTCCACGPSQIITVTLLTCLSLFVFDGLQSSFANYIYTYAYESGVKGLHKYEGAILDACFWGLFAAGRLIAVPVSARLTASFMLVVNIAGCSLALLITIIFKRSHSIVYVGTCSVGLFVSSMSPTVMSMAEQFVDINPSITTCMVVIAAMGEALCPVIVGNLVVSYGPSSFLVFCFTFSISAIFLYVALFLAGQQTDKYRAARPESFFWLSGKQIMVQGESTLIKPSSIKYYSRMTESDSNMELRPAESLNNFKDNSTTK